MGKWFNIAANRFHAGRFKPDHGDVPSRDLRVMRAVRTAGNKTETPTIQERHIASRNWSEEYEIPLGNRLDQRVQFSRKHTAEENRGKQTGQGE